MTGDDPVREGMEGLEVLFREGLAARQAGQRAAAVGAYRAILKRDPRLAEPYLELATLAAEDGDLDEAEALARSGVAQLRLGNQWTDDLGEGQLLAFALNLLGEVLLQKAEDTIEVDTPAFVAQWNEASTLFREALAHDPADAHARSNALHCRPLGPDGRPIRER